MLDTHISEVHGILWIQLMSLTRSHETRSVCQLIQWLNLVVLHSTVER